MSLPRRPDHESVGDVATDAAPGWVRRPIRRWRGGKVAQLSDCVAEEVPVALLYNDRPHVVMMASPRDLDDFALGFSLSEAIVDNAAEFRGISTQVLLEGIELRIAVPETRAEALELRRRNLTGRTSCGLCGAQALEDAVRQPAAVSGGPHIDADTLHRALAQLQKRQPMNVATGATHAAAWANGDGDIVLLREDVGRHNALDKLLGAMARSHVDAQGGFLVITSRASYEMVQKAATRGVTLMAAISAPTALAIQLAEATGVSLIGFARSESHVIYTHPQRIGEATTGIHA
jgi:FdhD protein